MTWGIASYSGMPSANTNINGINIAEGCSASGINDAIRQLMADLANAAVTRQILTASGTYTPTSASVKRLRVCMWGGGAGGAGTGVFSSNGFAGGDTSFNGVVAKGAPSASAGSVGGSGGTGGAGTATGIIRIPGFSGGPGMNANSTVIVSNYGGTGGGPGGGPSGTAATGNCGAGGAGAGAGAPGMIVVEEFYI